MEKLRSWSSQNLITRLGFIHLLLLVIVVELWLCFLFFVFDFVSETMFMVLLAIFHQVLARQTAKVVTLQFKVQKPTAREWISFTKNSRSAIGNMDSVLIVWLFACQTWFSNRGRSEFKRQKTWSHVNANSIEFISWRNMPMWFTFLDPTCPLSRLIKKRFWWICDFGEVKNPSNVSLNCTL